MRIIGLAGWSGAGKTTLLAKVIPLLVARGLKVSTLKHAHHAFDVDQPGKDSYAHRLAGATEVLVGSARRWALLHELREEPEPAPHPKLEVHRGAVDKPLLHPDDPHIVAIASDQALQTRLPLVHLDDIEGIAGILIERAVPIDSILAAHGAA